MYSDLDGLCISPTNSIREAAVCIDRTGMGIALVVDNGRRLIGTVSDGDIRRAIIDDADLDLPVTAVLENRSWSPYPAPVTAPVGTAESELLRLMDSDLLRQIPLLDEEGRVADLVMFRDLVRERGLPLNAVVMAGGYGNRLRPLTEELPKPMLPVGDRPLLELIIDQLRDSGIRRLHVTTHYKGELIKKHFGDGSDRGVHIRYLGEDEPLGTAGALCRLESSKDPLLVINGDILTNVDFRAMAEFHADHAADMTVAVKQHEIEVPYGVVETDGVDIIGISEKPTVRQFVNAGIYLINPVICGLIPQGRRYDIPELIRRLIEERYRVVSFPVREYWQDIGQLEDYQRALADYENGEI